MEFFIVDVLDFFDGKFSSHWIKDFRDFDEANKYALDTLKDAGYETDNIIYDIMSSEAFWDNGRLLRGYTEYNANSTDYYDREQENTSQDSERYWWANRIAVDGDRQILGKMRVSLYSYTL